MTLDTGLEEKVGTGWRIQAPAEWEDISILEDIILVRSPNAPVPHRMFISLIPNEPALYIQQAVCEITRHLLAEQFLRPKAAALDLKPALKSALKTINKAKDLTEAEISALNAAIGGAAIQNEIDIEEICSIEY